MNKTVTVNISGFVFYIEEDAYTVLSTYLNRIKSIFQSDEGGDEIVNDVEARIAELFHERLENKKEVVTMSDVEEVISVMGRPEDYVEDDVLYNTTNSQQHKQHYTGGERRKIYRDTDDKVLGGVCSGLAYYFNTEVLIIRVVFVLLAVLGLSGALIYLILWIIIPKAETTAEKLRMQGESINVENIKKKVSDFSNSANISEPEGKMRSFVDRAIDLIGSIFGIIIKVLTKIIGLFFGLLAIGMMVGLVALLVSPDSLLNILDNSFTLNEIKEMVFHGNINFYFSVVGISLMIVTLVIGLIYGAIRLLTGSRYMAKGLVTSLIILFFIGAFTGTTGIIKTVHDYHEEGETEQFIELENKDSRKLHVQLLHDDVFHSNLNIDEDYQNYWEVLKLTEDELYNGQDIFLETKESKSENFRIKIIKESQGPHSLEAINFAENISYRSHMKGDTLLLAPYFKIPREDGLRIQKVKIQIYVPEDKYVTLDRNTSRIELWGIKSGKSYKYQDGYRNDFEPELEHIKEEPDSLKNYKL